MTELERQRQRLKTLEDAEKAFIHALSVYRLEVCDKDDYDIQRDTVRLELRLKKRIAEVGALIMGMIMNEEEIA